VPEAATREACRSTARRASSKLRTVELAGGEGMSR
jgi:hypothetical protein